MPEMSSGVSERPRVLEFFAGIGLARIGLEQAGFEIVWSNDIDPDKCALYQAHFRDEVRRTGHEYRLEDIRRVRADQLPTDARVAWASSPCTDLSLAGGRAGLAGTASSVFWEFTRILGEFNPDVRPEIVVLENVTGLATSHSGEDISAAIRAFNELGYSIDVLSIDARRFVAQSRPRLFLVGLRNPPMGTPSTNHVLRPDWLQGVFGDDRLRTHRAPLPAPPAPLTSGLGRYVEDLRSSDERWWGPERTEAFLASLSAVQRKRIAELRSSTGVKYRTAYRRTRNGVAVWEVRPDDISGCLRTARGGSSKQAVVKVGNHRLAIRWMTPREYARLMGAGDYNLEGARVNQALFGFGDAVVAPVVKWLGDHYLRPAINGAFASPRPRMGEMTPVG